MADDAVAPPDSSGGDLEQFMRTMFTSIIVGLSRSLKQHQLTVAELAALHLIDRYELRVGELALLLDITLPAASRAATVLVGQGLVMRNEDPADRRARTLALSDAGRDLIDSTSRERVATAFATAAANPGPVMERIAAALGTLQDIPPKGRS
jgi:DNA-binding MarR family transcriptional regulator